MSQWTLTRLDNGNHIEFPEDLQWIDEFDWAVTVYTQPVYTLSGSLLLQSGKKKAGRPITLSGEWVWVKRYCLLDLLDWLNDAPLMQLSHYDGRTFTVLFRLYEQGFNAQAVQYTTPEKDSDRYTITLNLIEVKDSNLTLNPTNEETTGGDDE